MIVQSKRSSIMRALKRSTLVVLALLPLAACAGMPLTDPNPSPPRVMPDGRVVQPPPGGWPSYNNGGESGGSGGRN
jgi:hypothetical protein